jgi:hypothetical protein
MPALITTSSSTNIPSTAAGDYGRMVGFSILPYTSATAAAAMAAAMNGPTGLPQVMSSSPNYNTTAAGGLVAGMFSNSRMVEYTGAHSGKRNRHCTFNASRFSLNFQFRA